jgi:hypothetical protein
MAGDEVGLESYATFADDDLLGKVVLERMLAGLATRRHRAANEPVGEVVEAEAISTSRSAVSRRFIAGTTRALNELMSRDLAELDVVVLMVDGVNFGEACCVVALAISSDGTKVPVGLWLGDTENTTVVTALMADLVERGLDASGGLLVVIDGAKALAAGCTRSSATRCWCSAAQAPQHRRPPVRGHPAVGRSQARPGVREPGCRRGAARRQGPGSQPRACPSRRRRVVA